MAKYTAERTQEIGITALGILQETESLMTIAEIQKESILLAGVTPQKISRELNKYAEMGTLFKTKKDGRVAYAIYLHS